MIGEDEGARCGGTFDDEDADDEKGEGDTAPFTDSVKLPSPGRLVAALSLSLVSDACTATVGGGRTPFVNDNDDDDDDDDDGNKAVKGCASDEKNDDDDDEEEEEEKATVSVSAVGLMTLHIAEVRAC